MTIAQGFADLQISTEDYTLTKRFKLSSTSTSKKTAKQKADSLRNKGKKVRVIWEEAEKKYAIYVRS